jgi:hypothetical protein
VKKLIFFVVVAFLTFKVLEHNKDRQREKLVGVWSMARDYQGISCRLIMNLKPDGDASVEIDASFQGQVGSKDAFGKWKYKDSALAVTFDRGEIPIYKNGKEYGGKILALEEKTLRYKPNDSPEETWTRLR